MVCVCQYGTGLCVVLSCRLMLCLCLCLCPSRKEEADFSSFAIICLGIVRITNFTKLEPIHSAVEKIQYLIIDTLLYSLVWLSSQ